MPTPNIQKEDGWTALMFACQNGHYQVVELLLHNNADILATTDDNLTALVFACFNGHSNIIHLLVDKQGIDPVITEFIKLCIEGDTDHVKTFLPQVDLNTPLTCGITPLMMASCHGHIDIVNVLLQHKAKVNSQDDSGSTALDYAISRQHDNIVSLIMNYEGVSKSDILQTLTESTDEQSTIDDVITHHHNVTHHSDNTMHQSDIITHHSDVKVQDSIKTRPRPLLSLHHDILKQPILSIQRTILQPITSYKETQRKRKDNRNKQKQQVIT